MSIYLEAKDFYGLPLKIGDFVISGVAHLSGKITNIYKTEDIWIEIFNEETKNSTNHLNPNIFTAPERHAIELENENEALKKEVSDLKQRLEKSEAARLNNL